jgi:hypothetical protein
MQEHCWCGNRLHGSHESLGCAVCNRPCCPACAFQLGHATYCARCAETRSWQAQTRLAQG